MLRFSRLAVALLATIVATTSQSASGFSVGGNGMKRPSIAVQNEMFPKKVDALQTLKSKVAILVASAVLSTSPVYADEIGRETEAPTLFTGETFEICTKRGPLGACLKTELRTSENDNDKADKYFRQPTAMVKSKDDQARTAESVEGNALIEKLKQQTEDNREKNELLVQQRTFLNDASASFGPFDGQVLILNEDGKGFTLLENPQAMRLKKAGFIEGKKFIKQPTKEQIEDALVDDSPGFLGGLFGGN